MEDEKYVYESEITCPYCGYQYNDSWEFPDDDKEECPDCNKKFNYSRNVSVSYCCNKDCEANDEAHEFEWRNGAYFCKKCPEIKLKEKEENKEVDKKI